MAKYTQEDIIRLVEEQDVEFIRLQFTDSFGNLKNMAVTASQVCKVLANRVAFDGSSIEGFAEAEDADLYLYPDLDTFVIFPWRPQQGRVARFICDIRYEDGTPYECDSRQILKKAIEEARAQGYELSVGTELEFFLLELDEDGLPSEKVKEQGGYFDVGPADSGENARREMVMTLEEMGFVVEASHHELAPAQHEIDLNQADPLTAADNIVTFKMAVRTIARRHGLHATFMPKPKEGTAGSGMHMKLYLKKGEEKCFGQQDGAPGISDTAYRFMTGVLNRSKEMALLTNPLVNSYKRLVPGGRAPIYIGWSETNRAAMFRILSSRGGNAGIVLRNPDPAANPYLVLALCIKAGLLGINGAEDGGKHLTGSASRLTSALAEQEGIERLPQNLGEALNAAANGSFVKEVLGERFYKSYLDVKKQEWENYSSQVSKWEIEQYLNRF